MIALCCPRCGSFDLKGSPRGGWFTCNECKKELKLYDILWKSIPNTCLQPKEEAVNDPHYTPVNA